MFPLTPNWNGPLLITLMSTSTRSIGKHEAVRDAVESLGWTLFCSFLHLKWLKRWTLSFTCDQDVVNHLEQGLWKQDETLSGLLLWPQPLSGNSLNTPASSPAHTTWRWRTPRPHVALHWQKQHECWGFVLPRQTPHFKQTAGLCLPLLAERVITPILGRRPGVLKY